MNVRKVALSALFFVVAVGPVKLTYGANAGGTKTLVDDTAAIDRLHQRDIAATLSGKADDFAKLWSGDAIRMEPRGLGEVGLADHLCERQAVGGARWPSENTNLHA